MATNGLGEYEKRLTDDYGDEVLVETGPRDNIYVTFKDKGMERDVTMAFTQEQLAAFRKVLKTAAKRASA